MDDFLYLEQLQNTHFIYICMSNFSNPIVFSFQMPTGSEDDETCTTFVLHEEDHTLGNSLRYIIMKKYDK